MFEVNYFVFLFIHNVYAIIEVPNGCGKILQPCWNKGSGLGGTGERPWCKNGFESGSIVIVHVDLRGLRKSGGLVGENRSTPISR